MPSSAYAYANRYHKGEAPLTPLQYQFQDSSGAPLNISAHTSVAFVTVDPNGAALSVAGTIVAPLTGMVSVAWTAAMTSAAGRWEGVFWLSPGPVASVTIVWSVIDGPGPTI